MAPDNGTRPVSGEILTGGAPTRRRAAVDDRDVVEAEYETVLRKHKKLDRSREAAREVESSLFNFNILIEDEETDGQSKRAGPAFWVAGFLVIAAAFWISGGHSLLLGGEPAIPTATGRMVVIDDVRSSLHRTAGKEYLLVEGYVSNRSAAAIALPDLLITVNANDGGRLRYRISGGMEQINAGSRYAFSSRLDAPLSGVANVKVVIRDGS